MKLVTTAGHKTAMNKLHRLQRLQQQYFSINETIVQNEAAGKKVSKLKWQLSYVRKQINSIKF